MANKKPADKNINITIHGSVTGSNLVIGDDNQVGIGSAHVAPAPLPTYSPTEEIPAPADLPIGSRVPHSPNPLFTGRVEVFKQLAVALLPSPSGRGAGGEGVLITQAVTGMGGVGKTQLAVEFAHRYGKYFRGVHWLNLIELSLFESEIATCGRDMRLANFPENDQPAQVTLTLQAWMTNGPRLVILDNFEDLAAANDILPRLRHSNIRVLVTSRRSDWLPTLGLHSIPLNLFTPAESLDFLQHALNKRKDSDADLHTLAERLGHLPLGLELASRYLNGHLRLNVSEYLTQAKAALEHPSMNAWRRDMLGLTATQHDTNLLGTFTLSWQELSSVGGGRVALSDSEGRTLAPHASAGAETTTETAQNIFLAAGYLAPNAPIPPEIFEEALKISRDACDEALQDLCGLGLLKQEQSGLPSIHPLLAEYARYLGKGNDEILPALADTLATISDKANQTGIPADFNLIKPHLPILAAFTEDAKLEDTGTLWNNYGYHLNMIADYAGARAAYERALKIDEANFGAEHPNVATDVNNLGLVMQDLGDLNGARTAFERALKIFEKQLGENHPNVATLVNNLGNVMQALGDLNGARAAYERALKIDEAHFGTEHPNVAIRVNNLGLVMQALGDLNGARTAYERALKIDEANFGAEHPNVAIDVNNLGMVLKDLGDLNGARAAFERALKIDEAHFGAEHPNVAIRVNNLGSVLQALGDLNGARAAFERSIKIWEANLGTEHPQVAIGVNNLGMVLKALGDLNGARAAYERALAIFKKFLPPEHPNIKVVQGNLDALGE